MRNALLMMGLAAASLLATTSHAAEAEVVRVSATPGGTEATAPASPRIQVALLLDTSGSMSGLIDQARAHLWSVVNQFASARRDGQAPDLEVALYEYGKSRLSAQSGYVRQIVAFTDDLDRVSEALFALQTNGGSEYCGWVIRDAVKDLQWSADDRDLKVICIAGNEPFTQGPVDYQQSCRSATERDIIVNTIHCGDENTGRQTGWSNGALLGGGQYAVINHNQTIVSIEAPQDEEILRLNNELNATYIAYGERGAAGQMNQVAQDSNAQKLGNVASVERVMTKQSQLYSNDDWDLVDASNENKVQVEELEEEALPEEMRDMTVEERKAYVEKMARRRAEIQARLKELGEEREAFLIQARAEQDKGDNSLDDVLKKSLRDQAEAVDFSFE